ncbi:MAG: histone deacetylase family protein, partial [Tahibacter sp.]
MSMVALYTHAACLAHEPGAGHPESPQRLEAVLAALDHDRFRGLERFEAPSATRAHILLAHAPELVDAIFAAAPQQGQIRIDADTAMSSGSLDAALRAAGAVIAAVDGALDGHHARAFCAVRPPGHHATYAQSMGFCLFNNVAIGAAHALARGLERVAIVDFDVHHGNGTQDVFWNETRVLYASTHQFPLYPGTGARAERGVGNIHNVPLPAGATGVEFRAAFVESVLPALERFEPQLVMVSAGFDAHRLDPLANLNLDTADYTWATEVLLDVARRHAQGRFV